MSAGLQTPLVQELEVKSMKHIHNSQTHVQFISHFITHKYWYALGPTYNEHFDAWKSAHSSRVFIVTELFNIVVNEMVSGWH